MDNYYVNSFNGNNASEGNEKNPFKTFDYALKKIQNGNSLYLFVGNYNPILINSSNFEMEIKGSGLNTICERIDLNGTFNVNFKKFKINSMYLNISNSYLNYYEIYFMGFSKITLDNDGEQSELVFTRCTFNQSFQIKINSGKFTLIFKDCVFKGGMNLLDIKKGEVVINITNCNLKNPICNNTNADITIIHLNTIFSNDIFTGKNCNIINKNNIDLDDYNTKAIIIDSNIFSSLVCKNNTEFIKVIGDRPFIITLPEKVKNGFLIEIISTTILIILNNKYDSSYLKIRRVKDEWIFY